MHVIMYLSRMRVFKVVHQNRTRVFQALKLHPSSPLTLDWISEYLRTLCLDSKPFYVRESTSKMERTLTAARPWTPFTNYPGILAPDF